MKTRINWKSVWNQKRGLCILYAAECLLLLCLLAGMFLGRGQGFAFTYDAQGEIAEQFALPAGMYEVRVEYVQAEGSVSTVKVADGEERYRYLFANQIPLKGGETEQSFSFWLLFSSEEISLTVTPGENSGLQVQGIVVEKSRRGAYMAVLAAALLCLLLDAGLYCRERAKAKADYRERRRVFWGLAGIVILVSVPLLADYCLDAEELLYSLQRIEYVKDSLSAGHYPGRVTGAEGSVFCGNVFLLFPGLLRIAGFMVQDVWRLFLFVLNAATAWIAYSCFGRIFESRAVGLMGSMLYTWAPYRIYDLYGRAQLAESIALCFLPVVCLGLYLLLREPEASEAPEGARGFSCVRSPWRKRLCRPWLLLAVGFTGLIWSYFISFEVMAGAALLLCLLFCKKVFRRARLMELGKAALAVLILNAGVFLQVLKHFMTEPPFYAADVMVQHRGMYLVQYLFTFFRGGESVRINESGLLDAAPRGIGFAVTCLALVYLWMHFTGRYKNRPEGKQFLERFGGAMAAVGVLLMLMSTGGFPWDRLRGIHWTLDKLISDMRTPACLVPAVTLCFVLVSCLVLWQIKRRERAEAAGIVMLAAVLIAFCTTQFLIGDILREKVPLRIYNGEAIETVRTEADSSL